LPEAGGRLAVLSAALIANFPECGKEKLHHRGTEITERSQDVFAGVDNGHEF
jgi:hypothetical protein